MADFAERKNAFAVAMLGQHGVDQGAIAVDCAVEIAPAAANLQIRFINVQGLSSSAGPTTPPLSHLMGQNGCELRLPLMDSLVAKDDAVPSRKWWKFRVV